MEEDETSANDLQEPQTAMQTLSEGWARVAEAMRLDMRPSPQIQIEPTSPPGSAPSILRYEPENAAGYEVRISNYGQIMPGDVATGGGLRQWLPEEPKVQSEEEKVSSAKRQEEHLKADLFIGTKVDQFRALFEQFGGDLIFPIMEEHFMQLNNNNDTNESLLIQSLWNCIRQGVSWGEAKRNLVRGYRDYGMKLNY